MGAHALLAGAEQVIAEQPLVERHLGTLEHGANGHSELFAASIALDQPGAMRLAHKALGVVGTTMRTHRPVRPMQRL